jgi:hypothetical protein
MAWNFEEHDTPTMSEHLFAIERISSRAAEFWRRAHGWAPKEVAELLSEARLDWVASFNRTLPFRVQEVAEYPDEHGALILAWAHLRALVEGTLKLFLSVFLLNYLDDPNAPKDRRGTVMPDVLPLEKIRQFLKKSGILATHLGFIEHVQQRGNAIHAFADRPIGTADEFMEYVVLYRYFLQDVDDNLPTP